MNIRIFNNLDGSRTVELLADDGRIIEAGICNDFNELVSYIAYLTAKDQHAIRMLTKAL